jgi:hypothetical protein
MMGAGLSRKSPMVRNAPISIAIGEGLSVRFRRTRAEIPGLLGMSRDRQRHREEQHAVSKESACHIEFSNFDSEPRPRWAIPELTCVYE